MNLLQLHIIFNIMENSTILSSTWDQEFEINTKLDIVPEDILPPEAYRFFPDESDMLVQTKHSKQRIIFQGGVKYTKEEKNCIEEFKNYLEENGLELDSEYDDSEILRFLQVSKFNFKNTHEYILKYIEWRAEHIPPWLTELSEKLIRSGYMYIHGRDRWFRPLIVLNPTALLSFKSYDQDAIGNEIIKWSIFIIEYIMDHLFLPGQIENYVIICDVNKLGVTEIPKSILGKKIIDWLSKGYRYRSKRMHILNTNWAIKIAWKVIEGFMANHMKSKIIMTDKNNTPELLESFHPSQLEK